MVDWAEIGIVVVLVGLECIFDAIVVAWAAGRRSKKALVRYLESDESRPLWERQAQKVLEAIEPRITEVETRISTMSFDLTPAVNEMKLYMRAEVERIRAVIDGKLGFGKKIAKQTGEALAAEVGNEAVEAAGIDTVQAEIISGMTNLLDDREWVKKNPGAAVGLRIIKSQAERGKLRGLATPGGAGAFAPGLSGR